MSRRLGGARPVVLCGLRHYLPGYRSGGPVRSLSNLIEALSNRFDFRVVCLDRDQKSDTRYPDIEPGRWYTEGPARVCYLAPRTASLRRWRAIIAEVRPDLLYVNSLFDVGYSLVPVTSGALAGVPRIVAPRGELSPGALGLKASRKRLFVAGIRQLPWYRSIVWHACSDSEVEDIRRALSTRAHVHLAPNIPVQPHPEIPQRAVREAGGDLRVLFLSRIARKKNLLAAIRVVAAAGSGVRMDVWGPVEDPVYADECRRAASVLGAPVTWRGDVPNERVRECMTQYDVLLLPTLGENFGHVIYEAFSCGVPVIASDRTPWRGLAERGVGADIPLEDEEGFVGALQRFARMTPAQAAVVQRACIAFATEWTRRHGGPDAHVALFEAAIGHQTLLKPGVEPLC